MDESVSVGEHSPAAFARLILERVDAGASGVLEVTHDAHRRMVSFVAGTPVAVWSTLPEEELAATLVSSGRVEASRMQWMKKHCGPDEPLVEGLLAAGSLSQVALDAHLQEHLFSLIGASMGWPSGEWEWSDAGASAVARFDPILLPSVDALEAMIHGVLHAFERGALRTYTQDADAGNFVADPLLTGGTPPSWVPQELKTLCERLATGADAQALAESLDLDSDRVSAILWLLEAAGLVHRRNPPAALVPVGGVVTIVPSGKAQPKKRKVPAKSTKRTRMKKPSKATAATAKKPSGATARVKKSASPPPVEAPAKKAEAPTAAKPAPKKRRVAPPSPKPAGPKPTFHRAQELLDADDYQAAYIMLTQLRNAHPSCPDTLAALGWAGWRTGNHGTNAYDSPSDFLLLALTFDPAHSKALEYFARIAMDQGDVETARNRLLQLLQVDPGALWAREALESGPFASKSGRGGLGLRFWPKGKA